MANIKLDARQDKHRAARQDNGRHALLRPSSPVRNESAVPYERYATNRTPSVLLNGCVPGLSIALAMRLDDNDQVLLDKLAELARTVTWPADLRSQERRHTRESGL